MLVPTSRSSKMSGSLDVEAIEVPWTRTWTPEIYLPFVALTLGSLALGYPVRIMRIFSGIQSTGRKHLGNYVGAIREYVAGQDRGEAIY
jgi:hypothetical protein